MKKRQQNHPKMEKGVSKKKNFFPEIESVHKNHCKMVAVTGDRNVIGWFIYENKIGDRKATNRVVNERV